MAEKVLFARKATGLVREIGFTTAVLIALCNTIGLGWQKRVFQAGGAAAVPSAQYFLGLHPIIMGFVLIGIVILISVYAYAVLAASMPRSGGGYVFMSRILNPGFAFVATILEFLSIAVSFGLIAVATFEATLIFGGMAGVDTSALATGWFMTLFGVVVVALFSIPAAMGTRMTGKLLQILFWIPAAILVLVYLVFLMASPTSMDKGVQMMTGHTAVEYTKAAIAQGLTGAAGGYWGAVLACFPFVYWAYIGYAAASFVAGEVKEASRQLPKAMMTAGVIIVIIYITISFLLARAGNMVGREGGWSLLDAVAFLRFGGGSSATAGLPEIGAWMPVFAGLSAFGQFGEVGGRLFAWLLLLFGVCWVANDIPPFILTSSRLIFAMGFDRILPEKLADVDERWHSPVNAIIVTSIAGLFGVICEADLFSGGAGRFNIPALVPILSSGGAVTATDIWDILFFAGMGLACALFPMRKKDVFDRSLYAKKATLVQVMGWLAFLVNIWVGYVLIFDRNAYNFMGTLRSGNLGKILTSGPMFTVWMVIAALLLYYWGRSRAKSVGADLTTIYAEIPPE